ncbi:SRPBCC family protein [Halalkalibacter krulwichiae]|uniref:Polyketide cyclase / dehydrase and lipid transport n=1 Tax=Halalkalibacter krulwichiae TaxID=199441 RepID=A0A1X9MGS7_9BACI|nr:SRPBCC family protein [Halalkalibacter krulwichiae]ARK32667.1 Polyketide cyclase / dehydrase and lipid transport [Halalkalibacter krulwichiae]
MKTWTKSIEIDAPIEKIWDYFDGSLENIQKIMPQVVENKPVHVTEEGVGSVYLQTYKEGKRVQQYEVETLEYENKDNEKKLKIGFTLANMFKITARYQLKKINDGTTLLTYTATNQPLKWFVKLFLLFATEKVVVDFVHRVKQEAEKGARID